MSVYNIARFFLIIKCITKVVVIKIFYFIFLKIVVVVLDVHHTKAIL